MTFRNSLSCLESIDFSLLEKLGIKIKEEIGNEEKKKKKTIFNINIGNNFLKRSKKIN